MTSASCLALLEQAIDAAEHLGLDVADGRSILATARARLGLGGSAYVLAIVGGTGVGKSTLLNALAKESVSEAGARRPTTNEPIAWISRDSREEARPLLEWLGVHEVYEHDRPAFRNVAVLDLPDIDSTSHDHRAKVDELLPRVDAVVWVTDPEKYRDAVLHRGYTSQWSTRVPRQLVVLNKSDRIGGDAASVREHLAASLREDGSPGVPVAVASAREGDVGEVRDWIADGVEAKRVISTRIAAEARSGARELATRAGVREQAQALVSEERRSRAFADVAREAFAIVDLVGLERQAVAATRLAARPRGAGPFGHLTAFIYRASGRDRVAADPQGYLLHWRERGTLARAAEPIRGLVREILPAVPPEARTRVASATEASEIDGRIARAIDAAIATGTTDLRPPSPWLWTLIGTLQYIVTAGLVFTGLWLATVFLIHPPVGSVDVPLLGPVPTPLVMLSALLLAGYVLARVLGFDAGRRGRAWADRIRRNLSRELERRLGDVFAPLAAIDAARARLFTAARDIEKECRGDE